MRIIASFAMIIPEANAEINARHTSKVFLISWFTLYNTDDGYFNEIVVFACL